MSYPTLPEGCTCTVVGDDHYNTVVRDYYCPIHDQSFRDEEIRKNSEHKRMFAIRSNAISKFEMWAYRASEEQIQEFMKSSYATQS